MTDKNKYLVYYSDTKILKVDYPTLPNGVIMNFIDGYTNYVYVRDDVDLPSNIKAYSVGTYITKEELDKFTENIKRKEMDFKPEDVVFSVEYNKLPITLLSVDGDKAIGEVEIRSVSYVIPLTTDSLYKATPSEAIANSYQRVFVDKPNSYIVIDSGTILGSMKDSYTVVNFLFYVKSFFEGYSIVWSGATNKYVEAVFTLFGLPIVSDLILGGEIVTSDVSIAHHYNKSLIVTDVGFVEFKKVTHSESLKYSLNKYSSTVQGITHPRVSSSFINSIDDDNYVVKMNTLPKSILDWVDANTRTPIEYYGDIIHNIDDKEVHNTLTKYGWVWFAENYDYYMALIRG